MSPGDLARIRHTPPQVGLDRLSGLENVQDDFWWRGADLSGRSDLIVDEVAATGATIEAGAVASEGRRGEAGDRSLGGKSDGESARSRGASR